MPMFLPSKRDGVVGFEGSGDRQVLVLDTAVKDGVLGGVAGVVGTSAVVGEKLDEKKMIEELDLAEIPSVFIFPTIFISRSPLSRDQRSISTSRRSISSRRRVPSLSRPLFSSSHLSSWGSGDCIECVSFWVWVWRGCR
ncbi:hypothetical protein Dsin_015023 [Dipteronia sinensis]|uniref:Uncharacterized protein n=1 Tax=Dipteronia sinensis TaxID=43782 RepID=A0AAE0AN08_9ROSI|nr:hypothetical protein Dsin_015023 [Dipteronia sinensis]